MRRFGGAVFIARFFRSFVPPTLPWQSGYFLRAHFAATPYTCQVTYWGKALSANDEMATEQGVGE
jgi:hypothetical protein